jgi:histidine triad (HIT) family protein
VTDPDCLFCKISAGQVRAETIYEDDEVMAFRDINPQAPFHVLVIPRTHIATLNDLSQDQAQLVGRLFLAAQTIAAREGFADEGYRTVINCNEGAGQTVFHIHLHMLAGRRLTWPPG